MCIQGEIVSLPIVIDNQRKLIDVDSCIAELVRALNAAGILTVASCCGHGKRPGNVALADGRELIIAPDYETGRKIDKVFPSISDTATPVNPCFLHPDRPMLIRKDGQNYCEECWQFHNTRSEE